MADETRKGPRGDETQQGGVRDRRSAEEATSLARGGRTAGARHRRIAMPPSTFAHVLGSDGIVESGRRLTNELPASPSRNSRPPRRRSLARRRVEDGGCLKAPAPQGRLRDLHRDHRACPALGRLGDPRMRSARYRRRSPCQVAPATQTAEDLAQGWPSRGGGRPICRQTTSRSAADGGKADRQVFRGAPSTLGLRSSLRGRKLPCTAGASSSTRASWRSTRRADRHAVARGEARPSLFKAQPMTLRAYDVDCADVLDLTDAAELARLGIDAADLSCGWPGSHLPGQVPPTWRRGRAASWRRGRQEPSRRASATVRRPSPTSMSVSWRWSARPPHRVAASSTRSGSCPRQQPWR